MPKEVKCEKCMHCKLITEYGIVVCEYLNSLLRNVSTSAFCKPKYCSMFKHKRTLAKSILRKKILFTGKVADEPNEWVFGYLIGKNKIYQESGHGGFCGKGIFEVIPETIRQCAELPGEHFNIH